MGKILASIYLLLKGLKLGVFTGWKAVLWTMAMGMASIVIFNTFCDITQIIFNTVTNVLQSQSGGTNPAVVQATGLAAYLCGKLRIVECISYIISMVVLKWTLVKIPFVKW